MALGKTIREFGVKVSLLFDKSKLADAKKSIDGIGTSMKSIGLEVGGAVGSLLGFAAAAGSNARSLDLQSKQLGINVERLQELEYAAKVTAGVSREELGGALEGVSRTLFEARNNNVEAARTLIRMGVPLSMITDKTTTADQVLLNLSDRFKAMPDGMYKTALATETFGSAGAKLIPLLNKGALGIANMGKEGRNLGVILNENAIKQGAKFTEQFTKLWIIIKNISYTIGNQLIKVLMPLVLEFQKFIVENKKFIAVGLANVIKNIAIYLKLVFFVVKQLSAGFKTLTQALGGVEKVSKIVAIAMGVFTSVRILSNVMALVSAFKTLMFAITPISGPIGIAIAAFTALYFIVKDLFSSDSVIKKWLGNFQKSLPEIVDAFEKAFPEISETLGDLFDEFKDKFPNLAKLFGGVFDIVPVGLNKILEFLNLIITKTEQFGEKLGIFKALANIGDWIGQKTGQAGDYLSSVAQASKQVASKVQGPAQYMADRSTVQPSTVNHGDNTLNANMTFNLGKDANANEVSKAASTGIEKGFHAVLRQTRDQFLGGVAQ